MVDLLGRPELGCLLDRELADAICNDRGRDVEIVEATTLKNCPYFLSFEISYLLKSFS